MILNDFFIFLKLFVTRREYAFRYNYVHAAYNTVLRARPKGVRPK